MEIQPVAVILNNVNQLKMGHASSRESRSFYSFKPYQFVQCHPNKNISKCKPKPRSGHRIVCDDINLYSYGGYNPDVPLDDPVMQNDEDWENYRPLFREVWKFNLALQTWTKLNCAEIPDVLASNAVTLSGNVLMVFGGTGVPFGAHCSNDLFICDLSKKGDLSFTLINTSGDMPSPKYGQAIVLDNEFLYTVGGTTGYEYSCDIHRLDLRTKTWDEIFENKGRLEEPPGRYRHELAFNGTKIFVLGGGTAETAYGFEEICSFNLKKNKWEKFVTVQDEKHGYPSARRCHSSVQFKDEISGKLFVYIICGYNKTFICKDIWRLDLTTLQWTKLKDNYPMPIYFHSSAITPNGKVYTFGGIVKHSNCVRTDDVYSMWITIPKLKEICWEAFLYYNPRLQSTPKLDLIDSGIPHEFIRRLDTDSKS